MKTFINTAFIASALLASSLATAADYDSGLLSHPREGIVDLSMTTTKAASRLADYDSTLAMHPREGYNLGTSTAGTMAQTHCVNLEAQLAFTFHPREGIDGAQLQC